MLKKLIWYDMKRGYNENAIKLVIPVMLAFLFCIDFSMKEKIIYSDTLAGIGDYLMYCLGGMKIYIPSPVDKFEFPVKWILYYSLLLYFSMQYMVKDMHGMGRQMIIRAKKRKWFWYSKIIWNISFVFLWTIIFHVTVLLYCIVKGISLKLYIHADTINYMLQMWEHYEPVEPDVLLVTELMALAMIIAIEFVGMAMVLFLKPQISYLVLEIYLIASAYFVFPVFAGNYMMPLRNAGIIENGWELYQGIAAMLLIGVIGIKIGSDRFQRYNIE